MIYGLYRWAKERQKNSSPGGHTRGLHLSRRQKSADELEVNEPSSENSSREVIHSHGLVFYKNTETGVLVAIGAGEHGDFVFEAQRVVANGCFAAPAGTAGVVTAIHKPHTDGRTSNVIDVRWDHKPDVTSMMKLKDLEWNRDDGFVSPEDT